MWSAVAPARHDNGYDWRCVIFELSCRRVREKTDMTDVRTRWNPAHLAGALPARAKQWRTLRNEHGAKELKAPGIGETMSHHSRGRH